MRELNGANVLLLLRDQITNDLDGLCREFGFSSPTYSYYITNVLRQLEEAGLITHQPAQDKGEAPYSGRLEVSTKWPPVQHALGISLRKVSQMGSNSLVVTPYFGLPTSAKEPLDVLVLMSFDPKLRPIYDDHVLKVANSLNLNAKRADDFFTTHHVMSDVWEAINTARLVIADCTGRNPNVFYEIGMAHTLGRPVVLITQHNRDVPFDLQAIRYIQYEYTPPGMEKFEKQLTLTLQSELNLQ
jgi:hypothetical protein